jgi:hypothetical protein
MHREGINVNDVQPKDILCDFCGLPTWSLGDPCIEGHQGSIICGACLASAYTSLVQSENGEQVEMPCRMSSMCPSILDGVGEVHRLGMGKTHEPIIRVYLD